MQKLSSRHFLDLVAIILLLSFAATVALPRWRSEIDWRDEGLLAFGAVRTAQGEIPHRDFVSVQPPLSYYTAAAMFKFCGTSLKTLRLLGLTIFLLLPLLLYGIARALNTGAVGSFCASAPACVLGVPYVYFVPLAAWQGIAASLAGVFLVVPALLTARRWLALPGGILTAVSLFLRHDQGAYTLVSILLFAGALSLVGDELVTRPNIKRAVLLWLAGIAIVAVPALLFWWSIGALPEMFRQLVVFPFATYRKTSSLPFPRITAGKTVPERLVALVFYLPPVIQILATACLAFQLWRRRFGLHQAALVFLVAWSGLFYLQVVVRSDQTHLLLTLPPLCLLAAAAYALAHRAMHRLPVVRQIVASGVAAGVAGYLWAICSMLLPDVSHATDELALDRGGVRVAQAHVIGSFVNSLQTFVPPARSMLALPYQPMFYFLAERRNPTRWNYLWPGDQTTDDHQQFVEQAERDPPAVVLLSEETEMGRYAPVITDYVKSKYVRTGSFGALAIYVRPTAE